MQCRVTTEDPEDNFAPDYGRLSNYRSPAGPGIRLDGATAYSGAELSPYYDSLLVKMTTTDRSLDRACRRADRALREFRIRGVKSNIPFLLNVVNHPTFQAGEATTSFLDTSPELTVFPQGEESTHGLLRYLGDLIVNGNPAVQDRPPPDALATAPAVPYALGEPAPPGSRQRLQELGPAGFAAWARSQERLLITDTTMRDAHQSLLATRMRTHDLLQPAEAIAQRLPGLFSIEMWGGATFDASMRFLHEDPWERLRELRARIPNICFQMLLRASNAVGYTSYPDNVVREFVLEAARQGIDIFRIFDSLNSVENMEVSVRAALETDAVCEPAICYTGDLLDPSRPKYDLDYYVTMARQLRDMGAHILGIKDMAGLARPYAAEMLVRELRKEIDIPIHLHTHDTSGINANTLIKASEAGVDIVDAAVSPLSGGTSQPNLNSVVAALAHTPRDTGLDEAALSDVARYWTGVRDFYAPFDIGPRSGNADVYRHEIPGGQFTNLQQQAAALGLGHRWPEVEEMYARVNQLFGDIVKVTPSSKVVGDMAMFLLVSGMTPEDVLALPDDHDVNFPDSVREMLAGSLGAPPGGWPPDVQRIILRGAPGTVRPARRQPAARRPARAGGGAGSHVGAGAGAPRRAQRPPLPGGLRPVRRLPARVRRRERAAHAGLLLRHARRRGDARRDRARAHRHPQVPDRRRRPPRRHPPRLLRAQRGAAPGDGARPVAQGRDREPAQGHAGRAGARGRAHAGPDHRRLRQGRDASRPQRQAARPGGDEDPIDDLRPLRRPRGGGARRARPAGRGEGPAGRHRCGVRGTPGPLRPRLTRHERSPPPT